MWIVFFTLSGAANLYVVYHYDEATWVNFKLFGLLGLTFLFVLLQGIWLSSKAELLASSTEHANSQLETQEKSD
jgi:intracellular septation protein